MQDNGYTDDQTFHQGSMIEFMEASMSAAREERSKAICETLEKWSSGLRDFTGKWLGFAG